MPDTESEYVLLVEGENDEHIVQQLRRRSQPIPDFVVKVAGNDQRLLDSIGAQINVPERKAVGILADADDDPESRWGELKARFLEEGINVPVIPDPNGTIMDIENSPRIGIWVMPDNKSPGEIEDFVEKMIPQNDPVWPLSQRYINGIPAQHRKFRPGKLLRAKLYAWLATREIPGRMGAAIGAGDLYVNGPLSISFADWLRKLFQ